MSSRTRIVFAPDGLSIEEALRLTKIFGPRCRAVKVHDLFDEGGGDFLLRLSILGAIPWVDAKIHEKPTTAARRAVKIARKGARIISVHASGGAAMMKAVVEEIRAVFITPPLIWAVTLPTWLDKKDVEDIYATERTLKQITLDLALLAKRAGVDGVVCSPEEVGMLKKHPDLEGMELIVTGVRSEGVNIGDQKRVGTPKQALRDGASFIVIASEVAGAEDPVTAFDAIAFEIGPGAQNKRRDVLQDIVLH